MMKYLLLLAACLMCIVQPALAATKKGKQRSKEAAAERKKEWAKDPKHCEVCLKVMTAIHDQWKTMPKKDQKNKEKIETKIEKYCSKKNKAAGPKERKLCYYLLPIKRSISTPMAFGADPKGICKKLERASAEVCAIKVSMAQCGGYWCGGWVGWVCVVWFLCVCFVFMCRFIPVVDVLLMKLTLGGACGCGCCSSSSSSFSSLCCSIPSILVKKVVNQSITKKCV